MSILLQPDDLAPGLHVAVYGPARRVRPAHGDSPRAMARLLRAQLESQGDGQLPMPAPGVPLRVVGISLPFVVCAVLLPGGDASPAPAILDLRRVRLARLNDEFVQSLAAFRTPPSDEASDGGAEGADGESDDLEISPESNADGRCDDGAPNPRSHLRILLLQPADPDHDPNAERAQDDEPRAEGPRAGDPV